MNAAEPPGGWRSPRPVQTGQVTPASNFSAASNSGPREWQPPKCIPNWLVPQMHHHKTRPPNVGKASR